VLPSSPLERDESEDDDLRDDWDRLAAASLAEAYGEDEPEYPLDLIKRLNPKYEKAVLSFLSPLSSQERGRG
jgi:hypothetical protein